MIYEAGSSIMEKHFHAIVNWTRVDTGLMVYCFAAPLRKAWLMTVVHN